MDNGIHIERFRNIARFLLNDQIWQEFLIVLTWERFPNQFQQICIFFLMIPKILQDMDIIIRCRFIIFAKGFDFW